MFLKYWNIEIDLADTFAVWNFKKAVSYKVEAFVNMKWWYYLHFMKALKYLLA